MAEVKHGEEKVIERLKEFYGDDVRIEIGSDGLAELAMPTRELARRWVARWATHGRLIEAKCFRRWGRVDAP